MDNGGSSSVIINITFHGVGDPQRTIPREEQSVWLSLPDFESILDAAVGRTDIGISVDDGNLSDLELALPALLKRDLKATFFVLAGRLNSPGSLTRGDLLILKNAGMKIGLHGMHHRPWRSLKGQELDEEIDDARKLLEDVVGQPITWAACPFGSYGGHCLAKLRERGFERVLTSDRGRADAGAWLQPRNTAHAGDRAEWLDGLAAERPPGGSMFRGLRLLVKRWR